MIEKYVENFRYAFIYENYLTPAFKYTDYQEAFINQSLNKYERENFELIKKFYFGYLVKFK